MRIQAGSRAQIKRVRETAIESRGHFALLEDYRRTSACRHAEMPERILSASIRRTLALDPQGQFHQSNFLGELVLVQVSKDIDYSVGIVSSSIKESKT